MYKLYCRIYQGVMKIGMYLLPWSMPEVIEGEGSIKKLPKLIKEKGFKKVLIVTDKTLVSLHLLDSLFESLKDVGIAYVVFDGVDPNPTDLNVEEGVKIYKDSSCDAMIAFGGGSPMDCAKGIGARIARPKKSIAKLQGLFKVLKRIPTIFTVPTTAGTGSETTIAAVITEAKTHHKASINDLSLMLGLPPKTTATTGMDALAHAVEAYTNNTYNSKLEKDLSKKATKLIYDNLLKVYENPKDIEGRQNLQRAAFYAGRAFTRGSVGYVHAIGHTLGGLYGTPHGLAMSILLPHVMRAFGEKAYDRLSELCDVCGITPKENTKKAKAEAFIEWIEDLKVKMGIPLYPEYKEEDIDQIVEWAYKEGNPLYPTPVTWTREDFKKFILSLR